MIRADQIPDEVVEAAKTTYTAEIYKGQATAREYHEAMLAAITAALNAWPGVEYKADAAFPAFGYGPAAIILPLPQEGKQSTTEEGRA